MTTKHIVLLGDSVFDNAAYVNGGIDVIGHLRNHIQPDWQSTLRAVDGSITLHVPAQMSDLPADTTHLVVSIGGNDALQKAGLLEARAQSSVEVLNMLADAGDEFQYNYTQMLRMVLAAKLPTTICTVYYPRFPEPTVQRLTVTALSIFNDVIIKEAFRAGIPLLDLRLICDQDEDYANPIEPSEAGGRKIAAAIVRAINSHDFESGRTSVFI